MKFSTYLHRRVFVMVVAHFYFLVNAHLFPVVTVRILQASDNTEERQRERERERASQKTCLYNFDPLKPHFYSVKLGFTGVYIIFLISALKHRFSVLVRGGSNEYPQSIFEQKYEKYQRFLSENVQFLEVKFSTYLHRRVFVMVVAHFYFLVNAHLFPVVTVRILQASDNTEERQRERKRESEREREIPKKKG